MSEMRDAGDSGRERPAPKGRKAAWTAPELTEYGNIVKLTEGGTKSEAPDHGANMMRP
jgi:hypothetical protein